MSKSCCAILNHLHKTLNRIIDFLFIYLFILI